MIVKLLGEVRQRVVILGYHHQTRGILVNPVHQSNPVFRVAFHHRQLFAKMIGQRIDQRPTGMADAGMHHHTCCLVYNQHIFIFVPYIQRYILRHQPIVLHWPGKYNGYLLAALDFVVGFDLYPIHQHRSRANRVLYTIAGYPFHAVEQKFINAQR